MSGIKNIVRLFIPPVFYVLRSQLNTKKPEHIRWTGKYNSWKEISTIAGGYDADSILENVKNAILKVKSGEIAYERDGVIFSEMQYNWPLRAVLLEIALQSNNKLNVLDFGGSLGSTYFQNRDILKKINEISWNVVEQLNFAEAGNKYFQSNELKFYTDLLNGAKDSKADVLLASSVVQYIEKPFELLEQFLKCDFDHIIIDRTTFVSDHTDRLTLQVVPKHINESSYPCWFFSKDKFISFFAGKYEMIVNFKSQFDPGSYTFPDGGKGSWEGFYFKRI